MTAKYDDYDHSRMTVNDVIKDYDDLRESEILAVLNELYDDELDIVLAHELAGAARKPVLDEIGRLLAAQGATPVSPVPVQPTVCREKLCREASDPPRSYYCEVHEHTRNTSDHSTYQLLANILIELRNMNGKLDDMAVEREMDRIRHASK